MYGPHLALWMTNNKIEDRVQKNFSQVDQKMYQVHITVKIKIEYAHYLSKYKGEKKVKDIRNLLSCPEGTWKQGPELETLDVCTFYMYQHMMVASQWVYPE